MAIFKMFLYLQGFMVAWVWMPLFLNFNFKLLSNWKHSGATSHLHWVLEGLDLCALCVVSQNIQG